MRTQVAVILSLLLAAALSLPAQETPAAARVSDKQDLAVFALGWHGWSIPTEALGGIDANIMDVFSGMKRFNVIGFTQRMGAADLGRFTSDLRKAKESSFVVPEKYLIGEAFLTEQEFNRLVGSFYVVVPVVTKYENEWKEDKENPKNSRWQCDISTSFTFLDVSKGTVMAAPVIETSGSSTETALKAARSAIDDIPGELEFQARSVFPLDSKIVDSGFGWIRMRLGSNMGLKKGYEFSVLKTQVIDGITDEREAGLIVVKDVGSEFSDATVLYSDIKLGADTQLKEIPRRGTDLSPYYRMLLGDSIGIQDLGGRHTTAKASSNILGLKGVATSGFYDFRPFFGLEVPLEGVSVVPAVYTILPVNMYIGGEYNLYLGRLQLAPSLALGAGVAYVSVGDDYSDSGLIHIGGYAALDASLLVTRDLKIFAEACYGYWQSTVLFVSSYGGPGFSAGLTFKN